MKTLPLTIAGLPKSYLALMAEFPLLAIKKSGENTDRAVEIIHRLAMRGSSLDAGEQAYLEVLEALVESHDRIHYPIDADDVSPTRMLRMLVEQAGMTVTQLGKLLGSKGGASELLSGKRKEPSKTQIAKLCGRFKVDANPAFLRPIKSPATAA